MLMWSPAVRVLQRKIAGKGFLRSVAVLAGGSAVAQLLPMALTPLLTRLFSPYDMGILALYVAFIGIAAPLGSLQYSKAVVSARNDLEAASLGVLSLLLVVPTSLVFTAILWALEKFSLLGFGELPAYVVPIMFLSLLLSSVFSTFRFWQVRVGGYAAISRSTIWQSIGRVLTQVFAGFSGFGSLGLVLGEVLGRGLGLRALIRRSDVLRVSMRGPYEWGEIREVARRYKKFPLLSSPSMLLNTLALSLPVPLISAGYGVSEAGQFSIATRVLLIPMALVGSAVGDVFHNKLADFARNRPQRARGFFYQVSLGLLAIAAVPMVVVLLFGPELWSSILGEDWAVSGSIAQAIVPWVLAQFVVSPVSQVIPVYQRQELKLVYDLLGLLSVAGVLYLGPELGWSLLETCAVLGISQAVVYAAFFILLARGIPNSAEANMVPYV